MKFASCIIPPLLDTTYAILCCQDRFHLRHGESFQSLYLAMNQELQKQITLILIPKFTNGYSGAFM